VAVIGIVLRCVDSSLKPTAPCGMWRVEEPSVTCLPLAGCGGSGASDWYAVGVGVGEAQSCCFVIWWNFRFLCRCASGCVVVVVSRSSSSSLPLSSCPVLRFLSS